MTKRAKSLTDSIESEIVAAAPERTAPAEGSSSLESRVEKTRVRQKSYVMDLRIHSPASLGYLGVDGLDTAPALVRLAKVKGIDVIAVTDFYSGRFVDRVVNAARNSTVTVIPGVVIRCSVGSCNDVPLTCLFPECYTANQIEEFLRTIEVPQAAFGDQRHIVKLPFEEVLKVVERYDGVAIPSQMDKMPHRLAVVPLLVDRYGFRAFDLAYADSSKFFKVRWPKVRFQLFSFSSANTLAQVGSRIAKVKMPVPGFAGIRQLVSRQEPLGA